MELYEICKNSGITCYSPVNLNSVFIRKFNEIDDYKSNFLSRDILDSLCNNNNYQYRIKSYFDNRLFKSG